MDGPAKTAASWHSGTEAPEYDLATILRLSSGGATGWAFTDRDGSVVSCKLTLRPQNTRMICIEIAPVFRGETMNPIYGLDGVGIGDAAADRAADEWIGGCARLSAAATQRCRPPGSRRHGLGSLHLLEGEGPERSLRAAGDPKISGCSAGNADVVLAIRAAQPGDLARHAAAGRPTERPAA